MGAMGQLWEVGRKLKLKMMNKKCIGLFCLFWGFFSCAFCQKKDLKTILKETSKKLHSKYALKKPYLVVYPAVQKMYLMKGKEILKNWTISSSKYGIGCKKGSNKTPYGIHKIKNKIGKGAPLGTIFKSRINTGKKAIIYKDSVDTKEDYVTTRIMWLEGMEKGINKGADVDSYKRYIYIHGTPEEGLLGIPSSHGCIRMRNDEIIHLFDTVDLGTIVYIIK